MEFLCPPTWPVGRIDESLRIHTDHSTHQAEYESWLDEIGTLCKPYPGHLDIQTVSQIDGLTGTYTVPPRRAGSPSRNLLATLAFHAAGLVNLARDSY